MSQLEILKRSRRLRGTEHDPLVALEKRLRHALNAEALPLTALLLATADLEGIDTDKRKLSNDMQLEVIYDGVRAHMGLAFPGNLRGPFLGLSVGVVEADWRGHNYLSGEIETSWWCCPRILDEPFPGGLNIGFSGPGTRPYARIPSSPNYVIEILMALITKRFKLPGDI